MSVSAGIERKLREAFGPESLEVVDESEQHRGHAGWREGGETHFTITIASDRFAPMSRLERHRAVHAALGPDLVSQIHAIALTVEA